jgi:hypothetical protein
MFFSQFILPLALFGLSGWLIDSHRRAWRAAAADESLGEPRRRFARSQYRRRMQASAIIGLIAAGLAIQPLIPVEPLPMALYVAALVGGCGCMMALALLDILATRQNFHRLRNEQLAAQVKLVIEMRSAAKDSRE